MENLSWSWFWNKYKFNKEFRIGRCSLKKIGLCMYTYYIYTPSYMEGFFSKQKVSSLGNAINPTFSKGESSEIISLTVPSTYIILIHEPKFFFLEQNLWTTSTLYYEFLVYPAWKMLAFLVQLNGFLKQTKNLTFYLWLQRNINKIDAEIGIGGRNWWDTGIKCCFCGLHCTVLVFSSALGLVAGWAAAAKQ